MKKTVLFVLSILVILSGYAQNEIDSLKLIIPTGSFTSDEEIFISTDEKYIKIIGFRSDTSIFELRSQKMIFSSDQKAKFYNRIDTIKFESMQNQKEPYSVIRKIKGECSNGDVLQLLYKNNKLSITLPFCNGNVYCYRGSLVISKSIDSYEKPEFFYVNLNTSFEFHIKGLSNSMSFDQIDIKSNQLKLGIWDGGNWKSGLIDFNNGFSYTLNADSEDFDEDRFSLNDDYFYKFSGPQTIKIFNSRDDQFVRSFVNKNLDLLSCAIKYNSENDLLAVISQEGKKLIVYDFVKKTTKQLTNLEFLNNLEYPNANFSPDANYLVICDEAEYNGNGSVYYVLELKTDKWFEIPVSSEPQENAIGLYIDDKSNLYYFDMEILHVVNLEKRTTRLCGKDLLKSNIYSDFAMIPSKELYVMNSFVLNKMDFYNLESKLLWNFYSLENNNWLVQLHNSPYYMCSKDASKMLHYVTPSLKVIGFDQLDPVYNRPDIVLDSIGKYFGNEDRGMIEEYKKAWEKRIERLGLDKGKLSNGEIAVPNAEILNADQIEYEDKDGSVIIHVKANDPKYTLRRYNVLVNEVPVYGSDGISISELNSKHFERTDTIALSIGNNKIQVSVMNELGLENFKYPTYVNYTPKNDIVSKTYYVGIGVNEFKHTEHNLKYCVKDVKDLAKAFAKNQTKVDTLVFTNSEVTKENILALKSYLQKNTTVNDKVIISCSSHGLLDDSLNFYLATYDVDFAHPEKRGLAYEDLEGLLDGIPARQKLLLLDACNSGPNEQMLIKEKTKKSTPGYKGVNVEIVNDEINTFHQMTELFVNVRNNTGSVIIAASGGMQSAQEGRVVEGKKIENGAFTYSVLQYLAKDFNDQEKCTVNGMKNYVERRVEEITNAEQKPTSRQETMEVDWSFK